MSLLEVRNLTKRYGDFTALGDISLDIAEGEFVCFLGPSGCGKTTLLRAIAGLDPQTSGTIHQKGRDGEHAPNETRGRARSNRSSQNTGKRVRQSAGAPIDAISLRSHNRSRSHSHSYRPWTRIGPCSATSS